MPTHGHASFPMSRQDSDPSAMEATGTTHAVRLASGGGAAESTKSSVRSGALPSTSAMPPSGREERLVAKDLAAARESTADQCRKQAVMHASRSAARAEGARDLASSRTKAAASSLQPTQLSGQDN